MPRLRDILDWTYLNTMEYRLQFDRKTTLTNHQRSHEQLDQNQRLLMMIRERDALIKRLKETDEKSYVIHALITNESRQLMRSTKINEWLSLVANIGAVIGICTTLL
jgi:hypothetical protein